MRTLLVADAFPKEHLGSFSTLGLTVDHRPDVSARDLPTAARDASILVVRSKQVTAEVFEAAPALSLVVRAGAGVTTIDVAAASRRGFSEARGVYGRTLALAGLGAIGREVARRGLALGMRVVAWSRSLDDTRARAL